MYYDMDGAGKHYIKWKEPVTEGPRRERFHFYKMARRGKFTETEGRVFFKHWGSEEQGE